MKHSDIIGIALCDDSHDELQSVKAFLNEYISERGLGENVSVITYNDPSDLIDDIHSDREYHIYILDIIMPGTNGLQLGKMIRQKQPGAIIIFLSPSDDFFPQAFDIYAFQYQLKPVKRHKLFEIMDKALSFFSTPKNYFSLTEKKGSIRISFDQILYAELFSRTLVLHLKDGKSYQSGYLRNSFEAMVKPLLEDPHFIHPHKSYVVNLECVRRLTPGALEISDGSSIPISRNRAANTKKAYMDFLFNGSSAAEKRP